MGKIKIEAITTKFSASGRKKQKFSNSNGGINFHPISPVVRRHYWFTSWVTKTSRKYYCYVILLALFRRTEANKTDYNTGNGEEDILKVLKRWEFFTYAILLFFLIWLSILIYTWYKECRRKLLAPRFRQTNALLILNQAQEESDSGMPQTPPPNYDLATASTSKLETQLSELETSFTPPPKYEHLNQAQVQALLFSRPGLRSSIQLTNPLITVHTAESHSNVLSTNATSSNLSKPSEENL